MLSVRAATIAAFTGLAFAPAVLHAQNTQSTAPATNAPSQSSDPSNAQSPINLPPVTVTAARGSDIEKLDVSTTVMTQKEIQAMPETGIDQIVNRIPGVWSLTIPTGELHPTGQPVNIRGFGSSTTINTLVMVDGVPINDPYFRTVDWSTISKASIDRIEVIRGGGATSLWGNMAMGGVINIITKQPTRTGGGIDANYGSYNTAGVDVDGSVVTGPRFKVGVNYSHQQSSGYNLTPAQYQNSNLVPTASQVNNIGLSTYLEPNDRLKLFIKAYYHQAYEDGLVWSLAHNGWSSYRLLMGGTYEFADKSSINFSAWAGGGVFSTINAGSGSYSLNNIYALNQYVSQRETAPNNNEGGSVFYQLDTDHVKDIKVGFDLRRTQITDYINLFASSSAAPTSFISQGEHRLEGAFAQGTFKFDVVPLDVTVGLRGDFYQAMNASVLTVNSNTNNIVPNSSSGSFDPRVGFKYYVTDEVTVRGAIYRNFSEPGMNQMYRSFASGTSYTATNPNLQPMTNTGEEIGFEINGKRANFSATYFNNNMQNFIDYVTICNTNPTCAAPYIAAAGLSSSFTSVRQYNNVGNANFNGFELIGGWQVVDSVRFTASFTYTNAVLTSSYYPTLERTGVQLGQVPQWMLNLGAEWRPLPELALNINLKSFPAYWNDTGHTQLNEGTTLIDLGASYRLKEAVELYGMIQNLTNAQYLAQGYTLTSFQGSTVSATSIPAMGMPLTVSAGLRARF
ncbi:Outer membrane receptor for ferrienterochelin and colicins [Enhydrobacter aerosaccus]|uniref:Outer membrane receptor for ferrienterochelin and colicins n=1 Tax=Enhydrobacter aerosaccus TaxID=225324 RepID=A0A1T4RRR4_9HYPH|nr:TonB-dependent receptor [Enhydrobacter aerosaccus]SKA18341.1 Outer membrane receptor for ferrienterochelin and colicins [Enhydrobacter aerosaccus]